MQSPSPQRRQRERERESHLLKDFFCSATARLLQLCGGVWERQSFRFFNFFLPCTRLQVSPRYIGMKIRIFFSLIC